MLSAERMNRQAMLVVAHDHTMYSLAARRRRGERAVFANCYAPLFRQGGVDRVGLVIGGDPPLFGTEHDDAW